MKLELLPEPDLEFGGGTHIDIRFGIRDYGPIGFDKPTTTKTIKLGFVGTALTIQGVREWMSRSRDGVAASPSKKPRFRPAFPGFGIDSPFRCDWATEPRFERSLQPKDIKSILTSSRNEAVQKAADFFMEECRYLDTTAKVDVIICAPPIEILRHIGTEDEPKEEEDERPKKPTRRRAKGRTKKAFQLVELDFHDLLKALSLTLSSPIQFVRPPTYDQSIRDVSGSGHRRGLQDMATRAWNFHAALYYKAGGTPWRLLRRTSELESCYIGISFFRTADKQHIHTSVAQVFNERGEGMILRGGEATMSKEDRQPHLVRKDMKNLITEVLKAFEKEHQHLPARAVIHKTSTFNIDELEGCEAALSELRVCHRDLLVIRESNVRLFRHKVYPPLRGTFLELDEKHWVLYSRGSIPFFEMYPGLYVPRGLEIEAVVIEESPRHLGQEVLALTKMNWNNTQFDSAFPITIRAARQVGAILKYASSLEHIQSRYAFYM